MYTVTEGQTHGRTDGQRQFAQLGIRFCPAPAPGDKYKIAVRCTAAATREWKGNKEIITY